MDESDFLVDDYDDSDGDETAYIIDNSISMVKDRIKAEAAGDGPSTSASMMSIVEVKEQEEEEDAVPLTVTEEKLYEPGYELTSCEEVFSHIENISKDVGDITALNPANCRILLRKFEWNREKFIEAYTSYEEKDVFLADHFYDEDNPSTDVSVRTNLTIDRSGAFMDLAYEGECDICCVTGILRSLVCGHTACEDCWTSHFKSKINEGELEVLCMENGCKYLINDEMMKLLLSDEDQEMHKIRKMHVDTFVHVNKKFKFCPGKNCNRVVKLNHLRAQAIYCDCGENQCSACRDDCHLPIPCGTIEKWTKQPDAASTKWVSQNSRGCPDCKAPIEKNGGCNFMQCQNPVCRIPFCWVCMRKLPANHAPHDCHVYVPSLHKSKDLLEVERYEHYFNRFKIHEQSLEKEKAIINRISYIKDKLCARNEVSKLELKVFDRAALSLSRARTVAMFTNAFAFYMEDSCQREILEDNQKNLEQYTEKLSSLLEKDLEKLLSDASGYRILAAKLLETTHYLDQRRDVLLTHCDECVLEKIFIV